MNFDEIFDKIRNRTWIPISDTELVDMIVNANMNGTLENNDKERMKWIKNKLPWYITKFCRISSNEIILKDTSIFIGVSFGKSARSNCYIELTPRDID